jgi:hypothetical protein
VTTAAPSGFGPHEVRVTEATLLCEAHCSVANELYALGRRADALLQAARPMTDVFPWLETELRSSPELLKRFMNATAALGAEIRRDAKPRAVRRRLKDVVTTRSELVAEIAGEASERREFRASVVVALLGRTATAYATAVTTEDLGDYQVAYATARAAADVSSEIEDRPSELVEKLSALAAAFPSPEPPALLARPETIAEVVESAIDVAAAELGARLPGSGLDEALVRIDRLLDDVVSSYERGVAPLSARLAASLFVRTYDPIRLQLAEERPDLEPRVTELLGVEIRRGINDGMEATGLRALADEARALMRSVAS